MAGGGFTTIVTADTLVAMAKNYPEKMGREATTAFRDIGITWERGVKDRFGRAGGLSSRTGSLVNSIAYRMTGKGDTSKLALRLTAGDATAPYAKMQEFGGKITPKNGKFLTIPMDEAKTAGGDTRGDSIIRKDGNGYRTDRGPTWIYEAPDGRLYVAVREDGGSSKILYALRRSVTIPGPKVGQKSRLGGIDQINNPGPMSAYILKRMGVAIKRATA